MRFIIMMSIGLIVGSMFGRGEPFGPALFLTALVLFWLAAIIGRRNRGSV